MVELGILAYPFTILWMVGIANAINLVDGMDGLAGGIAGFAALAMGIIALLTGHFDTALIAFALLGGIIGFLFYNLPPARIFMGDSGSLFIGFTLAIIPLLGISPDASTGSVLIPVTLLTVPILDTLAAIIRRIKKKMPIIAPDKEHIHHKLLELGLTDKKILTIIYSICLYLSIVSITSVILPRETNIYLVMTVWVGSMLAYYTLELVRMKRATEKQLVEEEKINAEKDEDSTTAG
jgi:UDP-GlcNAc:undecaprenyl-phosphate GlcNAc-1-phosphate transferase